MWEMTRRENARESEESMGQQRNGEPGGMTELHLSFISFEPCYACVHFVLRYAYRGCV